jgi:hypothetical protein
VGVRRGSGDPPWMCPRSAHLASNNDSGYRTTRIRLRAIEIARAVHSGFRRVFEIIFA